MSGDILLILLAFIITIPPIMLVHELGHFLAAKLFRLRVYEFGIGFPPRLFSFFRWKETLFTLNIIPLGAFVRLDESREGFPSLSAAKRLAILIAGPLFNLLFGAVLLFVAYKWFSVEPVTWNYRVVAVSPNSVAESLGIRPGDVLLTLDGESLEASTPYDSSLRQKILERRGQKVTIGVSRKHDSGEHVYLSSVLPPTLSITAPLGVSLQAEPSQMRLVILDVPSAIRRTYTGILAFFEQMVSSFRTTLADESATLQFMGPVGITSIAFEMLLISQDRGPFPFLYFLGSISILVALTNLLPIPLFDGGRIVLILLELIRRRPLTEEAERRIQVIGGLLLLFIVASATMADVLRLINAPSP